ncbi:MAG: SDR family oxidoreductase [Gemmatimonadota bacterium]
MQVILITGCSSGFGLATAVELAAEGHTVYASMRDTTKGEALREAASARGATLTIVQLDVDDSRSVERAVAEVLEREGRIDVLVNNAGIAWLNAVEHISDAEAMATLNTNLLGVLRTQRAVLPAMRAQQRGLIINISSMAAKFAIPGVGMYGATKAALEALSECLASEVYPYGVRVVLIQPGTFRTPILQKAIDAMPSDPASPYAAPLRRVRMVFTKGLQAGPDPSRVAEVIAHVISLPEPKLRYAVGDDAVGMLAGRTRVSDEEFVALGRHESDEEYFADLMRIPFAAETAK